MEAVQGHFIALAAICGCFPTQHRLIGGLAVVYMYILTIQAGDVAHAASQTFYIR
jgi:hypothetical protein